MSLTAIGVGMAALAVIGGVVLRQEKGLIK